MKDHVDSPDKELHIVNFITNLYVIVTLSNKKYPYLKI